ncbi:MAG: hypothetical protein U9R54_07160, partial [Bacteroidota bacterium]|nr:hypothetical protein [Bacteroidota bacterium]
MMKIQNLKKKKNKSDINLDQILKNNNIDYSEIDFSKNNTDILKSYKTINNKLNKNTNYLAQLKTIISFINFN